MTNFEEGASSLADRATAAAREGLAGTVAHLRRFWAYWLGLSIVVAAAAVGFSTGLDRLLGRWIFPYNHSYLVLGMAAWLLIGRLRRAELARVGPSAVGALAVVAVVIAYALAEVLDFTLGMQVMLPVLLLAVLAALAGLKFARYAALPVAFLYFTIPIWDLAVRPLQEISSAVVALAVQWTGITAFIEGHRITLTSGAFEIAEGCSGMRYFLVSLAMGAFYGLCWYRRWRTRLVLLAVAGGMAMISNWIRIYALIVVGDVTDMQHYLIAESHDEFGWVVFVICMAPALWFARWLELREPRIDEPAPSTWPVVSSVAPPVPVLITSVIMAAVVVAPALVRGGETPEPTPVEVSFAAGHATGWRPVGATARWEPEFQGPHLADQQAFVGADGVQVDVYLARYLGQSQEAKLIARRNRLHPNWQSLDSASRTVLVGDRERRVQAVRLGQATETRLLWYWYIIGGRPTDDRTWAKLLEIPALLQGRRDGAIIILSSACGISCEDAEAALGRFLADSGSRLEAIADGSLAGRREASPGPGL